MDRIYKLWQATKLAQAATRFCITINGRAGTHKTTLSKLIVAKMAENGLVGDPKSWIIWPTLPISYLPLEVRKLLFSMITMEANITGIFLISLPLKIAGNSELKVVMNKTLILKGVFIPPWKQLKHGYPNKRKIWWNVNSFSAEQIAPSISLRKLLFPGQRRLLDSIMLTAYLM